MSIFCSLLQLSHQLEPHLPETTNYSQYLFKMHEKTQEKQKDDIVVLMVYNYIVLLYLKTNHFSNVSNVSKIKFNEINKIQINNLFSENERDSFFNTFHKAQKVYLALSKFAYICKMKITPLKTKTDMLLNDIDLKKKNVFLFLQNKTKYAFVINDLINIITASLSNCSFFFEEPLPIKNPYNNMILSKTILYNLYFYMKSNLFPVPILFELYYRSHFEIDAFKLNDAAHIREVYITNFVERSHHSILYQYVFDMIDDYKPYMNKIHIDRNFPKDVLVNIMRPYLKLYFFSQYLLGSSERKHKAVSILKRKLFKFSSCNPEFGRRIVKFLPKESNTARLRRTTEYNKECVSFFDSNQEPFRVNWEKFDFLLDDYDDDDTDDDDAEDDDAMFDP